MLDFVNTKALNATEKGMAYAYDRHVRLLDNVANIDRPGHTSTDISFRDYISSLSSAPRPIPMQLVKTSPEHMGVTQTESAEAFPVTQYKGASLEDEMTKLMETSLFFASMVQVHNQNMNLVKTAITEGRR
jgi:flagellar basal body rod protein FlgB